MDKYAFAPDYVVLPGKTLAETLEKSEMSQVHLAERTGLSRKTINGVITGREPITPDTAIQLEKVFRVPARFWLNLQKNYEEHAARLREHERNAAYTDWLEEMEIPVKELVARDAMPRYKDKADIVAAVFQFFGVAGPQEFEAVWQDTYETCCYRKSEKLNIRFGAVAAWLRLGELKAASIECASFDKKRLSAAIDDIRALVPGDISASLARISELLAGCGVALVLEPGIQGAPIYGATRRLTASSSKAILQMSLRGKDDGNFWFTLFHELGHLKLHGRQDIFLEFDKSRDSDKEREADTFAQDILILRSAYNTFLAAHGAGNHPHTLFINKRHVCSFAKEVGVSPGVVVGRLQRDGWLPFSHCQDLKVKLQVVKKAS